MLDNPNLTPSDWFSRAFGVTAGVIVAIIFGVFLFELSESNPFVAPTVVHQPPAPPPPASLPVSPMPSPAPTVPQYSNTPAPLTPVPLTPAPTAPPTTPDQLRLQVIARATAFMAQHGYSSGVFFETFQEGAPANAPDATHVLTGDIRSASSSTPFQLAVRVARTFNQVDISFERLTVAGARVYPSR